MVIHVICAAAVSAAAAASGYRWRRIPAPTVI